MSLTEQDATARLRFGVYWLLIALAAGSMVGRIFAVNSTDNVALEKYLKSKNHPEWQKQRPFLSANDRSRWLTVRALVEYGTYSIDDITNQPGWDTIDMVKHADRDGTPRLYSSKPPLLATLMAGPYWVIHQVTGHTLGTHPYEIGRALLILFNVVPMVLMFTLIGRLAERFGTTDWGRIYMVAAATLGTMLTTFAVVVNNHMVAAVSVAIALAAVAKIAFDDDRRSRWFVLAGVFSAFAAANELPALSLFAIVGAVLLWLAPKQTLIAFLPGALLVIVPFFATNYIAHDSLRPPYMHRSADNPDDNWYRFTFERGGKTRDSYWMNPEKITGIDRGEPDPKDYAVHALVGHHGIFSLTPVWILSFLGMGMWLARGDARLRVLAGSILMLSLTCIAFYLTRPQIDRNYGGMTSGLRWMFWFAPLWLVTLLPAADWLEKTRTRRFIAATLLALSALSVSYPTWNPWTHPWLMNFMLHLELVKLS